MPIILPSLLGLVLWLLVGLFVFVVLDRFPFDGGLFGLLRTAPTPFHRAGAFLFWPVTVAVLLWYRHALTHRRVGTPPG
jgi:hypothetical protein